MKKDIGILGATGMVGKGVLSALDKKGYSLLIGSRNADNMELLKSQSHGYIESMRTDVFNSEQIEAFCSKCKVVINCTAPASVVGSRVIQECVKQGNDYIDPFGEGEIEKYVIENQRDILEKKNIIVLTAGAYPGLSEVLFKYVAEQYNFDDLCIKEYFYGNGSFSHGATHDIISSMISNNSKSMSFIKEGNILPCKVEFGNSVNVSKVERAIYPYPIISKEFYDVCQSKKVKEGYFFNTFSSMDAMATFFEIGSQIYQANENNIYDYTEKLQHLYNKNKADYEHTGFIFYVEGKNGHIRERKKIIFEYSCNWNILSGYVCAQVAEQCMKDKLPSRGIYKFSELDNVQMFIENLPGKMEIIE